MQPLVRPALLFFAALFAAAAPLKGTPLTDATVVVYNSAAPDSFELARFYAEQRGIARDHLVALRCSTEEEITREEYDAQIAEPLRAVFAARKWWTVHFLEGGKRTLDGSTIGFVAMMKGMPLKIKGTGNYPGDTRPPGPIGERNEAAVDQEVAVLGFFSRQISGATTNPYFKSYRPILEAENPPFLLVARLDAPTAETVKRMIVDAIATEKTGLWGRAYVDSSHNSAPGAALGDGWMAEIRDQLHKAGVPVVYEDTPALFPEGYPMSDCALYYGWYSGGVAGPFARPDFHFLPGAVAAHIHSYSGASLREAHSYWCAPLLTLGAAATVGNVYEPYLQLTSDLAILNDRLLHGFTFAESAYMSLPALSWMAIVVGDPLYRPYASWLQLGEKSESGKNVSNWKMYHDFVVRNGEKPTPEFRAQAKVAASRARNGAMLEDLGVMEAAGGNFASATSCFQEARAVFAQPEDVWRVALEEADAWSKQQKPQKALDLVRKILPTISDARTKELFQKLEADLAKETSTPATPKSTP